VHKHPVSEAVILKVAEERKKQLNQPSIRHWKVIDTSPTGKDEMIAFAIWSAHNISPSNQKRKLRAERRYSNGPSHPRNKRLEVLNALFSPLREARKDIIGEKSYLMLNSIATHPEHRGRRAGSMLIEWGVRMADELGVEAYLDTTRMSRGLYEGFELVKGFEFDRVPWGGEGADWHGVSYSFEFLRH
ncbi:hypothetical protein K469DRAFT_562772, partial [Zopfia rhizophila CBS 207.26]